MQVAFCDEFMSIIVIHCEQCTRYKYMLSTKIINMLCE